jgi:hypothetical protein
MVGLCQALDDVVMDRDKMGFEIYRTPRRPATARSDRTHGIKVKRKITSLWVKLLYVLPLLTAMASYVRSRKMCHHGMTHASVADGRDRHK